MFELKDVISRILSVKNATELKATLSEIYALPTPLTATEQPTSQDPETTNTPDNAPVMGVSKVSGVSINRLRKEANEAALEVIDRVKGDHSKLTEDDKLTLRKYSGIGGTDTVSDTGGHIHEYYTPTEIAAGVWDGLTAMGFSGGNGLEPSAGTGVFQATKPKGTLMTSSEIDKTSSSVNQLLHPEDMVLNQPFEKLAADVEDGTFDSCIGNVPFGTARGATAVMDPDPASKEFSNIADYFVVRVIDKVKAGGLIGLVVPTRIISGSDTKKMRRLISRKAEFLGAHRLPSGVFSDSGTDVVTDIIFLRKHSEELAGTLPNLKDADLKTANVLWDTFINGKWFDSPEGKRFVHGESERLAFQNKLVVNNSNALTNAALKEKLGHKFESRIDWESLQASEPLPIAYTEGDEKLINGRWMQLVSGNWEPIKRENSDGTLNPDLYGASSTEQLAALLARPSGALSLTHDQLLAVHKDFPFLTKGPVSDFIKLASKLDEKYRPQVVRGSIIGMSIQALQFSNEADETLLAEARSLVLAESQKYGIPAKSGKLAVLTGKNANYWNAFSSSLDKNGEFSQLLNGLVVKGETIAFDSTDATQTVGHLFAVRDLIPVPMDEFLAAYTGTATSLEELAGIEGIAITPDGLLAPLDRATSGDIVKTKDRLLAAMAAETSEAMLDNYQRQLDEIERKRIRTGVDSIDMTMNAKWLPRSYVTEFLKENGYADIAYSKVEEDEFGDQFDNENYTGDDGLFSGYQTRGGKKRNNTHEQFERQIENYLNGLPVRSSDAAAASAYKSRIKDVEADFAIWLRQHDDIDQLVNRYNDKFNGFIPIEHSGAPIALKNVSGEIVNFDYQCAEIRRLSETGGGICGFGTGLGKSATALGLIAYNTELGRARRTGLVVPKAVIENWYHESKAFFGRENMSQMLFIGIDPVQGKDGTVAQEQVLDENGEVKINKHTGEPMFRDKVRFLSSKEIKIRLNQIPHSNFTTVVLTKEQYASIPMRPESVGDYVSKMVDAGMLGGKYVAAAKKHREALKNEKFKEKYADTGTQKANDIPYFEDMGFDNVIIDEGHNYRNSYKAGRESSKLAYLPTQASAQVSVDMAIKGQLIKAKNDGRGVVMLSATPTVNSPTDIFNMLSHVMTPDQWSQLGITDVDDFIKVFGDTDEVPVQKLSGEVEMKTALVGFRNLSGLRGIFHKHVNLKTAKDVSETVAVPDIVDIEQECPMTAEQQTIYEDLRVRAEVLSKLSAADKDALKAQGQDVDSVFRIIREMDRVTTDIDLYNKEMTFVFPASQAAAIAELVKDLPDSLTLKMKDEDKDDEDAETTSIKLEHNAKINTTSKAVTLVVRQDFEEEVIKRLAKFKIKDEEVSHPITPKYARLIENLKAGLEDGKQIIFTEEKTQHNKLKRIIANHLGMKAADIAIINADTVGGKDADNEQASLEKIALAYNEGQYKVLIANKKAEVGVNLHHGTTDIHHLTLPWAPASLKQRNGRGARVGAKQKKVRAHYYVGKGSFDEFRLSALKRKAEWMNELFTSDADRLANADASNNEEMSLLLAKDADEREARIAENKKAALEKVRTAQKVRASIDLNNYIKAAHDIKADPTQIRTDLAARRSEIATLLTQVASSQEVLDRYVTRSKTIESMGNWYLDQAKDERKTLNELNGRLKLAQEKELALSRVMQRIDKAESQIKRLRPTVEKAIKTGLIDIDARVIDQGDKFIVFEGRTFAVGKKYEVKVFAKNVDTKDKIYQIESINFDFKTVTARLLYTSSSYSRDTIGSIESLPLSMLRSETNIEQSELDLQNALTQSISVVGLSDKLTKKQFYWAIENGKLRLGLNGSGAGNSSNYYALIMEDGEFEPFFAGYGEVDKVEGKRYVYPDPNDASLKKKLAKWILADRANRAKSYGSPTGYYEAILGKSWLLNCEAYGNSATDGQINSWAMKTHHLWLETDEGKAALDKVASGAYSSSWEWGSFAEKAIPAEFDNVSAFEAGIKEAKSYFEKLAEQMKSDRREATYKGINAAYKVTKSLNDDTQLKHAKELLEAIMSDGVRTTVGSLNQEGSFAVEIGTVDYWHGPALAILERISDSDLDVVNIAVGGFTSAVTNAAMAISHNAATLQAALLGLPEDVETATSETEKVEAFREQVNAEAKTELDVITSKGETDTGITYMLNPVEINEPAKKVESGKRWYNNPARNFKASDLICLHDKNGKDGHLIKIRKEIKELDGAFYTVNLTDSFAGSWWFIPASIGLDKIKEIIGA
jgi:N12 class adenine-specific DNA methylase